MIDLYLDFSMYRLERFMDILNLKASATKISMMTAFIFGLNFFCLNELIFDSKQAISGISIVGGVIVFAIISTYLVKKKNSHSLFKYKNLKPLDIFFNVHVVVTLLLYFFIIFDYWR